MNLDWKQLEIHNTEAQKETIKQCKLQFQRQIIRREHSHKRLFQMFLQTMPRNSLYGYVGFIFLFLMMISVLNMKNQSSIFAFYGALGGYFVYQLFQHRKSGLEELLYTTPINGAKLFLFQISVFFMMLLSSLMVLGIVMINKGIYISNIMMTILLPLCISEGMLMLMLQKLHSFEGALSIYLSAYAFIIMLLKNYVYHSFVSMELMVTSSIFWIGCYIIVFVIFIFACRRYYHQLCKEGFYEINS